MQANSSANECPDYQPTHHLHLVVYSVVLAAGLPLNALALWVFLRALRVHSVVSVYMCNLAASDLLFTLSLPLRLSYYARHYWPFPDFLCQLAGAVLFCIGGTSMAGCLLMSVLAKSYSKEEKFLQQRFKERIADIKAHTQPITRAPGPGETKIPVTLSRVHNVQPLAAT